MRIAIFSETFLPKVDGVARTLCHLLDHLALRGHESILFVPEGAPEEYAATPVVGLSSVIFPFYPELRLVPPLADVRKQLNVFRPDLIHLVNPASLGLVGLRYARLRGVPVVASYHTDLPGYAMHYGMELLSESIWAYLRWIHNQADLNLTPSHFTKRELEAHGFERVEVWSHGVDRVRFAPQFRSPVWRERLSGDHPEAPLLIYVGRLAPEKRVDWLRPVLDALPNVRLAIVGDGPARSEMETLFANTPTVFTGYLRGADLSHAYASADLFAFASANETFGNVVLEAMASGLPVVAPRAGGPVDIVSDGRTGLLFDPGNQAEFIQAVRQIVSQPETLRRMGEAARAHAESQSWEAINDDLLEKYAALTGNASPRRKPFLPYLPDFSAPGTRSGFFREE